MAGYIGSKSSGIISGIDASIEELNLNDKVSANGTTEANKVLTADANKDVTAIRNLTATGTVTRALTRGSIDVGNSSGVSSALAKGAAGTVLTSDGTDLSFVAASGGGEQEFTATGAISAGDLVGFNPNGTISVVEAELQAAVAQGSGAAKFQALVYDTANDKVLLFFQGTSLYLYGRVGTIANGQISFGTAVTTSVGADDIHAAYDVNSGKTVVTYTQKNGNNYPYAVVVTVSGTDLSFGTPVSMKSSAQYNTIVEYDSNAQKVLCIYNANNGKVYGRVGTVSGTSISFGTEAEVSTLNATIDATALSFDSTANKFVLSMVGFGAGVPTLRVLTISGTSVSGGTAVNGDGLSNGSYRPELTYIPSINRTVLIQGYAGSYLYYYILTVSGTDITVPSGTRFDATVEIGPGQTYVVVAGDKMYMQYPESAGSQNTLLQIDVSTTQITFSPLTSKIQWGSGSSSEYPVAVYDPDTGSLVNADGTNVRILNATAPSFVGIAAENISNGATGKATVIGGINTSVSGLTAGKSYGITPSSASLSVAQLPSSSGAIGIALSSSSIYLNVGKI